MHSSSVPRRQHSAELKAKVLAACSEPGVSIAAVALSHGLNANLVRKWRVGRGLKRAGIAVSPGVPSAMAASAIAPTPRPLAAEARFLPIELSAPSAAARTVVAGGADTAHRAEPVVHIELRRGSSSLTVRWPSSAAGDCALWLRELASGLLR